MISKLLPRKAFCYAVVVFFCSFIFQLIIFDTYLNLYDDGIILVGAKRVLSGEIPYKDFWTMYSPGQFYSLALIFYYFGESVFWLKILGFFSKSLIVSVSFVYICKFCRVGYAIFVIFILIFLLIAARHEAFPVFPSLAFSMLAILFFSENSNPRKISFFYAGLLTGLSALFRHDIGFYTLLAVTSLLPIRFVFNKKNSAVFGVETIKKYSIYFLGIFFVLSPFFIYFFIKVEVCDLYFSLIYFPSKVYALTRNLPFPSLLDFSGYNLISFSVYLPLLTILPAIFFIKLNRSENPVIFFSLLLVFSLLIVLKGIVRVEIVHMLHAIMVSLCLLFIMIGFFYTKKLLKLLFLTISIAILFAFPLFKYSAGFVIDNALEQVKLRKINAVNCFELKDSRLGCFTIESDYKNAIKYVAENTQVSDRLYVGPARHDKIYLNAVAFYFLVDRKAVTKWHESHPGLQTTEAIQLEMISELTINPPKLIILDSRWDGVLEPNESSISSFIYDLDAYISKNYILFKEFGAVQLLRRREQL